jgi:hypothetical protein
MFTVDFVGVNPVFVGVAGFDVETPRETLVKT